MNIINREFNREKTVFKVKGMSCEHCVKAVTNALNGLAGVKDAAVDLKGGTASFSFDPSAVTLDAVKAAIIDEGYEVAG
ncbi:MAG: copper ion binding protein [Treponema sp.]|nr:copper ion binding protein [Treponema sp.]